MGFFDKLKREVEEKKTENAAEKTEAEVEKLKIKRGAKTEKIKTGQKTVKPRVEKIAEETPVVAEDLPEAKPLKKSSKEDDFEGELAIDVYETDGYFIVQSTIAGVKAEDLDITIENDIVTVRGKREKQISEETHKYYYQECYWGAFSRQVILPEEVDGSKAEASIKEGVLTLKIPKIAKIQKRKISIKQED